MNCWHKFYNWELPSIILANINLKTIKWKFFHRIYQHPNTIDQNFSLQIEALLVCIANVFMKVK